MAIKRRTKMALNQGFLQVGIVERSRPRSKPGVDSSLNGNDVAPTVRIIGAAAMRSGGSSFVVRLRLSVRDVVVGDRVSYSVTVSAGAKRLAGRAGSGESAALALRVTPPQTTRVLVIRVSASDPVGNTRTRSTTVVIRR